MRYVILYQYLICQRNRNETNIFHLNSSFKNIYITFPSWYYKIYMLLLFGDVFLHVIYFLTSNFYFTLMI